MAAPSSGVRGVRRRPRRPTVRQLFAGLQATIEQLHDVRLPMQVDAYLVDTALRQQLPGALAAVPEQLFVRLAPDDSVELALYVAPQVVQRLRQDDPQRRLHGGNLEAFCVALEGVSHFVYIAWRCEAGWPTRALELELQAEVDKFVASWLLLHRQGQADRQTCQRLLRQLFGSYVLHAEVAPAQRERYHLASRSAAAFCQGLIDAHVGPYCEARLLDRVRWFSRQALACKLV